MTQLHLIANLDTERLAQIIERNMHPLVKAVMLPEDYTELAEAILREVNDADTRRNERRTD